MALSSPAGDRWSRAYILDDVILFFCVVSFSPCRFYGELTKTVNASSHRHQRNPGLSVSCAKANGLSQWNSDHDCVLVRWYAFFSPSGFHGNRKMTMPTVVQIQDNNGVKHIKLVAVRHFWCVWLKVHRKTCCYFTCMFHIRLICSTSLQSFS